MRTFIKGMDLSSLLEMERCGAKYYDHGEQKDILQIMKEHDVDTIRVRLWNDPKSPEGEPYGAGSLDLATVIETGRRITQAGLGMLLNFHYSDFWVDPGKQFKPKAWGKYTVDELEQAVYDFTVQSLTAVLDAGVNVTMIQVGNELTNGLLWPEGQLPNYENCERFVSAGIRACRRVRPEIPIMIHLDNGGYNELYRTWFDHYFELGGADFEYIGMSYYPYWHGTLAQLTYNMNDIAARYGKDIIVAEVAMAFTFEDYAAHEQLPADARRGPAARPEMMGNVPYEASPEGQRQFMQDILQAIVSIPDDKGAGFFWWEPAWLPVPGSSWATPAAFDYLHDAGPVGNEWANQTLFDYDGNVLPTLDMIRDFHRPE